MNPTAKCGCSFAAVHHFCIVIGVFFAMTYPVSQAYGEGWSLNSTLSERLTFDDNKRQSSNSLGNTYGSITSLSADLGWQSPRLNFNLYSNFDINRFIGPGATSDLNTISQFHQGKVEKKSKTVDVAFSSSFRIQDTTFSELEDTGILSQNKNNRLTFSADGNVNYRINHRSSASLAASVEHVNFSAQSAALTPFFNVDLTGSLARKLTNRSEAKFTLGWSLYKADDLPQTTSYTYKANSSLTTKLSPRLSVHGLVGVNVNRTDKKAAFPAGASSRTVLGGSLELGLDYQLADMLISFTATSGLQPSAAGEIRQTDNIGLSVTRQINSRSNIGVTVSVKRHTSLSGGSGSNLKVFTIAPTYSYSIARNWNLGVGYNLRMQDNDGVRSTSNSVFMSMTRNLPLLK